MSLRKSLVESLGVESLGTLAAEFAAPWVIVLDGALQLSRRKAAPVLAITQSTEDGLVVYGGKRLRVGIGSWAFAPDTLVVSCDHAGTLLMVWGMAAVYVPNRNILAELRARGVQPVVSNKENPLPVRMWEA